MLKKISYFVITGGLLLASLGASAMVNDSPFPDCNGPDCTYTHDDARKNIVATASDSRRQAQHKTGAAGSPFPSDNSND
jgi:hypothetical protein